MLYVFIALAILLVSTIFFFFIFPKLKRNSWRNNFLKKFGAKVYKLAEYQDYYLINKLILEGADSRRFNIDHLLLSEKYFFVIKDYYFEGKIKGKMSDNSWEYYHGDGLHPVRTDVPNPIFENRERINLINTLIPDALVISVILINDDCYVEGLESERNDEFIVKVKDLRKFVEKMDTNNVPSMNQVRLGDTVRDLKRLSKN